MKILLLTQVLPYPPDSGPKVKTWNLVKYLAAHHEVVLTSFVRGDESASVRVLEDICQAVYTIPIQRGGLPEAGYLARSFLTNVPFLMTRDDRSAMRHLVDRLAAIQRFDIAHADQLNMAQYARRVPQAKKILDAHNALWLLYQRLAETMPQKPKRWLFERDWRLLKRYEGWLCREFDGIAAVSDEDRLALEEAAGRSLKLSVIPIAVDTHEIQPVQREIGASHILHMGTMYWPPNIDGVLWFLDEVLPRIWAQKPDAHFDIVGANPPPEIKSYGQRDARIRVAGYVPDPTPYLAQTAVSVVPLRAGGGMRVKILTALAQGLPLVTTSLGAEGIILEHQRHAWVADSPQDFAEGVLCLLKDRDLAGRLGRNGRSLIAEKYDTRATGRLVEDLYQGKFNR
jgi:glycosyltransferase involved in cell wall biosynthesis